MDKERYIRRFETVLNFYTDTLYNRSSHRGQLFESELEAFLFAVRRLHGCAYKHNLYRKMDYVYKQEMDEFIDSTKDLETEPHQRTASELFDYCARTYNLFMEPIIVLGTSLKDNNDVDFKIACQCFKNLKDAYFHDYYQPYRERGRRQRVASKRIKSFHDDKTIFLELTASIFFYLSIVDDSQRVSQIIKSVFNHLDNLLLPKRDITPKDIFTRLSHLPQPVYQGICNYFLQSGFITEALYYKLVLSIKSEDTDSFSTTISENNLYLKLTKYYDLIALADDLNSTLNERQFAPENYIRLISNYYEQLTHQSETKTNACKVGISVVGIYNDIKDNLDVLSGINSIIQVFKLNQFLLYERFCRIKFSTTSNLHEKTRPLFSIEKDETDLLPVDAEGNEQTKISNEVELNCKFQDKIDEFIDYLVWRRYIADENKQSFKYDVFGGLKPDNYTALSFNLEKKNAKTMLGVILWSLRKVSPASNTNVNLFGTSVTQSNKYIGPSKDSQRVYVDICLFFPSLTKSIIIKKEENENSILKARLIKRVKDLLAKDEFQKLSVLEYIKWLERNDIEYWVVSRKNIQEEVE